MSMSVQSAPRSVNASHVDVLVIGGGQAGLAAGFYLQRLARDAGRGGPTPSFAILDANEHPGGAWQHYWDTLELFSPAAYSSLPGHPMPPWGGKGNPSADHVVSYLRTYEQRYQLPVHRPVTVVCGRRSGCDGAAWNVRRFTRHMTRHNQRARAAAARTFRAIPGDRGGARTWTPSATPTGSRPIREEPTAGHGDPCLHLDSEGPCPSIRVVTQFTP